jgi:hypothetical protein
MIAHPRQCNGGTPWIPNVSNKQRKEVGVLSLRIYDGIDKQRNRIARRGRFNENVG